jgi:hypothetical protein
VAGDLSTQPVAIIVSEANGTKSPFGWTKLVLAVAVVCLCALVALWWSRRTKASLPSDVEITPDELEVVLGEMVKARNAEDAEGFFELALEALKIVVHDRTGADVAALSTSELGFYSRQIVADDTDIESLHKLLARIDRLRFAPSESGSVEDMEAAERFIRERVLESRPNVS